MSLRKLDHFTNDNRSFNMTPVIDIVFLLIIFFMVVCQFIEAENFPVNVPDNCDFALQNDPSHHGNTTVTILRTDKMKSDFAVGSQKIVPSDRTDLIEKIARLIDNSLKDVPADERIVTLRVDKEICFDDTQYALAAIAASSAKSVRLSTLKDKRPTSP